MNKKVLAGLRMMVLVLVALMAIQYVEATIETLGTFRQGNPVDLIQVCGNCSYVNITSIKVPNSTTILTNVIMTKDGSRFNYTFYDSWQLGRYIVSGIGDDDGIPTVFSYDFYINPTGEEQNSILDNPLSLIMIGLGIVLILLGVYQGNAYFGFIGGVLFLASGVYVMIYGFNNVLNLYTRGVAAVLLGFGIFFSIVSSYEWAVGD